MRGVIALSFLSLSSGTLAVEDTEKDLSSLSPREVAKQESQYNLDPNSPQYQEMLARRELMLELNQMYQALENQYSLESEMLNEVPLPPEKILEHRKKRQEQERASSIRVSGPVKETFNTMNLPMEQKEVIEVKIVPGYLSTLTFFDSTGAPWPIEYAQPGNESFQINIAGEKGNIINLDTSNMYADANASIGLVNQNHNYIIKLVANDKENTSKLSFRVPDTGPEANQQISTSRNVVENAPEEMYDIINGRIYNLEGAKNVKISGVEADGYEYNGFLYIVSRHNLLSPARENSVSLPSGTTAYKIYPTSSLQFSVNGKRVFASVEDAIGLR
jgi:hypothetical protein